MQKVLVFVIAFCLLPAKSIYAQADSTPIGKKISFRSINQVGIIKGESNYAFLFQTINGAVYKTWFAGVGIGLDDYYFTTFPVFLDIRKKLKNQRNSFFLFANAGISIPVKEETESFGVKTNYKKGTYYEGGIGYELPLSNKAAMLFSLGATRKKINMEETSAIMLLGTQYPHNITDHHYTLNSLSFKVGIGF